GADGMWDEEDGFYYDILRLPDGSATRLKVRSMVGLLPLCATTVVEPWQRDRIPRTIASNYERMQRMPELLKFMHPTGPGHFGVAERGIAALVNPERLRRILTKMLDEGEFLSPYGIRSLSKFHEKHPYIFTVSGQEYRVDYLPGESDSGMFGGNSNWRGPIWVPVNTLIIRALMQFYLYYGDNFKIECPTGSGKMMNLFEVAKEITDRLARIFLRDRNGGRPVSLDDIPDAELDRLVKMGFDWVWFLSVWRIGPAGQRVSRANHEWRREFEETLPDLREEDIAGSGFAITGYTVHNNLGGEAALARLRERLRRRGLKLLLDFVPNHTGLD